MQNIVRTVAGAALQTAQFLGLPVTILPNTSLNQKFDVQAATAISPDDKIAMRYVAIGNGGHKTATGVNGISRIKSLQHTPRDAALFSHLPFVLRLPNDDLDAGQRSRYRLRKIETHNGQTYVAYYLRVLNLTNVTPQLSLRTVANGVTTSTPYTPTQDDLNPVPPAINSGEVLVTTGDYVAATAKVPFTMDAGDVVEFLNACNIIFGDPDYAMISEIAVCSGVDRNVTGDFNGTTTGYTEAIGVQVCSFIAAFFAAESINQGIELSLDVGSVESLLNLT